MHDDGRGEPAARGSALRPDLRGGGTSRSADGVPRRAGAEPRRGCRLRAVPTADRVAFARLHDLEPDPADQPDPAGGARALSEAEVRLPGERSVLGSDDAVS